MRFHFAIPFIGFLFTSALHAGEPNVWTKLPKAEIIGQRSDIPLGYDSIAKRFVILGGRTNYGNYRKPRSYDTLTLDTKSFVWENTYPSGKDWGPAVGPCQAPAWKGEVWGFRDAEGNTRPNWTIYGTFSLGQKYDWDPDTKAFYFYAGGSTFKYDPAERKWTDLQPAMHPEKALNGRLLWSSMVYDAHNKQFLLFGGGNVESERGDPGTWTYSPARNAWTQLKLDVQPPQRANSRLAYDPLAKKIVLFGGDQLDQLLSDTWTFDVVTQRWEEAAIANDVAPSPRGGHALLWLPSAKRIALIGGYTYTSTIGYTSSLYQRLPNEIWTYDIATRRWQLIRRSGVKEGPDTPTNFFTSAAVDETDRVVLLGQTGTWTTTLDMTKADDAGNKKFGVKPGTTERREGPHDPSWYIKGVPDADPAKVAAELKDLPANAWKIRPTPKLPGPNMDWGSAVFSPELDRIMRFSGGHSAYSGTAPQVYDVKTDRYAIPFVPEYPLEYVYSNDQVNGEWSFKKNPWMTGHTYKSTGYDPRLKALVFGPHEYTYFFDPLEKRWSRSPTKNPYRPNFYVVTLCTTPDGVIAWANERQSGSPGLWRLDATSRTWKALPLKGEMPATSADHHGMAYDAKRDRLLLFSDIGKNKGDVLAYDFKAGKTQWLNAAGRDKALEHCRETVYLPEQDAVLIGARMPGEKGWMLYDCAANAWRAIPFAGDDPLGKREFNNSMGLMYDPTRRLVWAVGQNSHVHVLRVTSDK